MNPPRRRPPLDAQALRRMAEERPVPAADGLAQSLAEATRIVHELRVHQIELETQNEALQEARLEAEAGWAQVQELNETLERRVTERTAELLAANADQQSFCYMISHELRAPLARLEGFSRMLQQGGLADPIRLGHIAERIEASSQAMREMVDTLLVLSRISLEPIQPETLDLAELARDVLAALAKEGQPTPARVILAQGLRVSGDRRLLGLCLHNLLGNALKFTARTPEPRVEVGATLREGRRVLFVSDNGAGFDPAHAGELFDAFVRLHRQEEFKGTGLGLNIVRKIIEKHGGRIWGEAVPEVGATFYFTLGEG